MILSSIVCFMNFRGWTHGRTTPKYISARQRLVQIARKQRRKQMKRTRKIKKKKKINDNVNMLRAYYIISPTTGYGYNTILRCQTTEQNNINVLRKQTALSGEPREWCVAYAPVYSRWLTKRLVKRLLTAAAAAAPRGGRRGAVGDSRPSVGGAFQPEAAARGG